jgi:hypothetical protein
MKSKFLVNINRDKQDKWIASCATVEIQVMSNTKEGSLTEIKNKLKDFLTCKAHSYLKRWKGDFNIINCPEGKILLPVDIWKCKLNDETCPTQAQVFLDNEDEFRKKCTADERKKEQILNLIKENVYDGFHHLPGRLKCVLCRGKESLKYHYPWEINYLHQYIEIFDTGLRLKFLRSGIALEAYSCGLCPTCFVDVISILNLTIIGTFEVIYLDFYR